MLILNTGVPRSGTVLVNAMIRAFLRQQGIVPGQANPHGNQLSQLCNALLRSGTYRHKPILIHTHSWDRDTAGLLAGNPHVATFANYRDPRDVCVSIIKLHELAFETAMDAVTLYFQEFEATVRDTNAMVIPYELLVSGKQGFAFQIARHIGFWPTFAQIDEVCEETSVERHRQVMDDVNSGAAKNVVERQNRHRTLREDPRTLINDRHIQSGATGRWRAELTPDQQETATEKFRPLLERYGYDV